MGALPSKRRRIQQAEASSGWPSSFGSCSHKPHQDCLTARGNGTSNTIMENPEKTYMLDSTKSYGEETIGPLSVLSSSSLPSALFTPQSQHVRHSSGPTFDNDTSENDMKGAKDTNTKADDNTDADEELENRIESILINVRETINTLKTGPIKGSDGAYNEIFELCVSDLSSSTMSMSNQVWTNNEKFLQSMSEELLVSNALSLICSTLVDMLENETLDEDGDFKYTYEVRNATSLITNCACASLEFADAVGAEPGFLEMVSKRFTEWQHWHTHGDLEVSLISILVIVIGISVVETLFHVSNMSFKYFFIANNKHKHTIVEYDSAMIQ